KVTDGATVQAWGLVDNSGNPIAPDTANQLFGNPVTARQQLTPIDPLNPVVGYNGGWYYAAQPFPNAVTTWAQAFFAWGQTTSGYAPRRLVTSYKNLIEERQSFQTFVSVQSQAAPDAPPAIIRGTPVDLSGTFDRAGIASFHSRFTGGADGQGNALP